MRFINFITCVCIISFIACKDDPAGTDPVNRNGVTNGESSSSAFTLTVDAAFNGLKFNDRTYGKFGIMYCLADENAEQEFTRWAAGGKISSSDIKIRETTELRSGDRIHMTLEGLDPETEYMVCAFFESEEGDKRMIGRTEKITTKKFAPVIVNSGAKNPMFFSAMLEGSLSGVDSIDTKFCSFGFVCGKNANPTVQNDIVFKNPGEAVKNKTFKTKATYLSVLTEYHYRPYLLVNGKDYYYGEDKTFSTRDYEENAVDMGTGVMFSKLFLGADTDDEYGDLYRWGDVEPCRSGVPYALYDAGGIKDIGLDDISGTEYDPVRHRLGGDWRMATAHELDSLIEVCRFEPKIFFENYKKNKLMCISPRTGKQIAFLPAPYGYCYGTNGKSMRMYETSGGFYLWSSTSFVEQSSGVHLIANTAMYTIDYIEEQLDILVDQYLREHSSEDVIYTVDVYTWVASVSDIITVETVSRTYRYVHEYRPNNSIYDADYYYNNPSELNQGMWTIVHSGSSGVYAQLILPVRDKHEGE